MIIFVSNTKTPDMDAAIAALASAYESKDAEKIADAKTNCKDTLAEKNRLARAEFYKSKMSKDLVETRKAIISAGYITNQWKLVDKVKDGVRVIGTEASECQVNILEVNKLVRSEVFNDAFIIACARIFRNGACAYIASEMEKNGIEDALGFTAVKYTGKNSMNELAKSLQKVFDEILFVDNGGKNLLLAKKAIVKTINYWMVSKASHYGSKFASTEVVIHYITDAMWAILNGKDLFVKMDDITF